MDQNNQDPNVVGLDEEHMAAYHARRAHTEGEDEHEMFSVEFEKFCRALPVAANNELKRLSVSYDDYFLPYAMHMIAKQWRSHNKQKEDPFWMHRENGGMENIYVRADQRARRLHYNQRAVPHMHAIGGRAAEILQRHGVAIVDPFFADCIGEDILSDIGDRVTLKGYIAYARDNGAPEEVLNRVFGITPEEGQVDTLLARLARGPLYYWEDHNADYVDAMNRASPEPAVVLPFRDPKSAPRLG